MTRTKSSKRWLKRHFDDHYVKEAQEQGWRSRAVFKLQEIQDKDHVIKPGMNIVDLGAAPGGWSQIAVSWLKGQGNIFALDLLPMDPLPSVSFIQGDFREDAVLKQLLTSLNSQNIDLVMSDMAPNLSGQKAIDQPRVMYLAELALEFVLQNLAPGGGFIVKVFQGEGFDQYLKQLREHFFQLNVRKPRASRAGSREVYLVAKQKK